MDVSSISARQGAPLHMADLRPAADAAALASDPRPAIAALSTLPASTSQVAAVTRNLVESQDRPAPVAEVGRVLKPWGVVMLPALPEERSGAVLRHDRTEDKAGDTSEKEGAKDRESLT